MRFLLALCFVCLLACVRDQWFSFRKGSKKIECNQLSYSFYSWKEKLPLVKTPLESTWLRHEIGRCHLELGNYSDAKDFGEQSFEAALEADDAVWQLNASVLIAQADGMLFKFKLLHWIDLIKP